MKLGELMQLYEVDAEITCWDKDIDSEFYFYKKDPNEKPDPDFPNVAKFEDYLIKNLEIKEVRESGIIVGLYEMLENPLIIDYAKEKLYEPYQYEEDDDIKMLLFEDVEKNLTNGFENFSKLLVECFESVDEYKAKDKSLTEQMVKDVEELNNNTPDGIIIDADTILKDLIDNCDHEFTGFAQDVFNIWKNSTDRKAVEQMFYEFTDMEFNDYLSKCKKEITRMPKLKINKKSELESLIEQDIEATQKEALDRKIIDAKEKNGPLKLNIKENNRDLERG